MSLKGLITLVTRVHQPNWFLNVTNQVISTGSDVFYVKIVIYQDILEFQYNLIDFVDWKLRLQRGLYVILI